MKNARFEEVAKDMAVQSYRTRNRRTTRPNHTGRVAQEAEAHDGRTIITEAGFVTVVTGEQPQRLRKEKTEMKAAWVARQNDAKEAEVKEKGKGKNKEVSRMDTAIYSFGIQ